MSDFGGGFRQLVAVLGAQQTIKASYCFWWCFRVLTIFFTAAKICPKLFPNIVFTPKNVGGAVGSTTGGPFMSRLASLDLGSSFQGAASNVFCGSSQWLNSLPHPKTDNDWLSKNEDEQPVGLRRYTTKNYHVVNHYYNATLTIQWLVIDSSPVTDHTFSVRNASFGGGGKGLLRLSWHGSGGSSVLKGIRA